MFATYARQPVLFHSTRHSAKGRTAVVISFKVTVRSLLQASSWVTRGQPTFCVIQKLGLKRVRLRSIDSGNLYSLDRRWSSKERGFEMFSARILGFAFFCCIWFAHLKCSAVRILAIWIIIATVNLFASLFSYKNIAHVVKFLMP